MENYFKPSETSCKCGCGMDISPMLRLKLNSLREVYGKPMIITSGARCKTHNTKEGGAINSQHVLGLAVDIKASASEAYQIAKLAFEKGFKGIGIHPTFIHLDIREGTPVIWQYGKNN